MVIMKILKKVNVRLPFKYYRLLVDEPFGPEIRKFNTDFFVNDPRFQIAGYKPLTEAIRIEMNAMTPENYDMLFENMNILSRMCDDIIEYKSLKHNNASLVEGSLSDDESDGIYENRIEEELRKANVAYPQVCS
jgi:hypothetical protein